MYSITRLGSALSLLVAGSLAIACNKKAPECKMVIGSLNELGTKLGEAQKVTGNSNAKPEEVAAALRPFAGFAKASGDKLAQATITIAEIKKIAGDASGAAQGLSSRASKMAELAEQMKGLDAAGKAIDDQKKRVDAAEAGIKKVCEASAAQCAQLGKVLEAFPQPPENHDDSKAVGAWSAKLDSWAGELSKVKIGSPELQAQVKAYDQGWKAFASAMTTLVGITENAKKLDELSKEFNGQIDAANKAVADANAFCNAS